MTAVEEMNDLLVRLYDSIASGDPLAWSESLDVEALLIGTDAGEWVQGKDAVLSIVTA